MMEGGWRRHYQTHLFLYNSLMSLMYQTGEVARRNLRSLMDWLNAGRPRILKPKPLPTTHISKHDSD